MVLLAAWQYPSLLRRPSAGGHHAAPRSWPSRPRAPPAAPPAAPAAQPWVPAAAQQQRYAARAGVRAAASQQQPAGQPTPGIDPAVAAYLEQHGISATQLQQERPAAAAALTLPLACVLVKAVTARQGPKSYYAVAPAELAARLVFLASEAEIPVAVLAEKYLGQLAYLCFKVDSAREVLDWLRGNLSDAELRRVMALNPDIWRRLRPTLETAKADLQELFGLSHDDWVAAVGSEPKILNGFSGATAADVVGWLRLDISMAEEDISRMFRRQPAMFYQRASRLSGLLDYVLDRLHIDRRKAASVALNCCSLLNLNQDTLEGRIADVEQYGFTSSQIGKILLGSPLLLSCTFETVISPALSELEQLLTGHLPGMTAQEQRADVIGVAARAGKLLVSKPAKLRGNLDFLLGQGLSLDEARDVLRRNPQVFEQNMWSNGFGAKLRYCESELGIPVSEMLVKHSAYLKVGLAKVDQLVFCMERRGELEQLWPGERKTLAWTKLSLADFRDRYGVSLKEWEECVTEWPASERAQQYGLVEQGSKRGFAVDYDKAGAANKARSSRNRAEK